MKKKDPVWYRHLAAPGVEFHWRLAKGAPKRFELVIRSMADSNLERIHEAADINATPVTFFLQEAMLTFAREIEQRVLNERKRRAEQIAAREAAEQRSIPSGTEWESEWKAKGDGVKNDKVPAGDDKSLAGPSRKGAKKGRSAGGNRVSGQPKDGPGTVSALY